MKKYLVIGNPIKHSLSPELHNYWIKKNSINAVYDKQKINEDEIERLILEVKKKNIHGINVTVPYKKIIIKFLDQLSLEAQTTQSVNTIYLYDQKIIGHNTDVDGFELAIKNSEFKFIDKKIFILGAGGVVSSIIFALIKMKVSKITISNRTRNKAENLKNLFKNINVVDWGEVPEFDIIINATSVGLNKNDKIQLDLSKIGNNKIFYDVIYNPRETSFLKNAKMLGHRTENGKLMFLYQALAAFKIWHRVNPEINEDVIKLLEK